MANTLKTVSELWKVTDPATGLTRASYKISIDIEASSKGVLRSELFDATPATSGSKIPKNAQLISAVMAPTTDGDAPTTTITFAALGAQLTSPSTTTTDRVIAWVDKNGAAITLAAAAANGVVFIVDVILPISTGA